MKTALAVPEDDGDNRPELSKDRISRQESAVALRVAGANYSEIARTLGYRNATEARRGVEEALARSVGDEDREQMRFLEGRRIERILRSIFPRATNEDDPEQLAAARVALMLIDRHSKLYGLDAPTQVEVYNPSQIEIQAWLSKTVDHIKSVSPAEADVIEGFVLPEGPSGYDEASEEE